MKLTSKDYIESAKDLGVLTGGNLLGLTVGGALAIPLHRQFGSKLAGGLMMGASVLGAALLVGRGRTRQVQFGQAAAAGAFATGLALLIGDALGVRINESPLQGAPRGMAGLGPTPIWSQPWELPGAGY